MLLGDPTSQQQPRLPAFCAFFPLSNSKCTDSRVSFLIILKYFISRLRTCEKDPVWPGSENRLLTRRLAEPSLVASVPVSPHETCSCSLGNLPFSEEETEGKCFLFRKRGRRKMGAEAARCGRRENVVGRYERKIYFQYFLIK